MKGKDLKFQTECIAMCSVAASFHINVIWNGLKSGSINVIVNEKGGNSIDISSMNKQYMKDEDIDLIKDEAIAICLERAQVIFLH